MEVEIEYRDFIAVSTILLNTALFSSIVFQVFYPLIVVGIVLMLPLLIRRYERVNPVLYLFSIIAIAFIDSYTTVDILFNPPPIIEASSKMAILVATWSSLASILLIKSLRSPLNTLFTSLYLKTLSFAPGVAIIHSLMSDITMLIAGDINLDVIEELFIKIALSMAALAPIYLLLIKPHLVDGYQGIYRHLLASYPPVKLDIGPPTYLQISDLRFRVYRIYRVFEGEFQEHILEEAGKVLNRIILYYGFDGYVYLYLVSEALTIDRAYKKLVKAEKTLMKSFEMQCVEEDLSRSTVKVVRHPVLEAHLAMDRPLSSRPIEYEIGTLLTFEYRDWRYMLGLYRY